MENIIRECLIVIFLTSQIYLNFALPQRLESLTKNMTDKIVIVMASPTGAPPKSIGVLPSATAIDFECNLDLEEIKHSLKRIAYR